MTELAVLLALVLFAHRLTKGKRQQYFQMAEMKMKTKPNVTRSHYLEDTETWHISIEKRSLL